MSTGRVSPSSCGEQSFTDCLRTGLNARAPLERWYCAEILGMHRVEGKAVEPLAQLLSSAEPQLRSAACRALARSGEKSVCARIVPLLSDSYSGARLEALRALSALGCPAFSRNALPLLKDSSVAVRCEAAALLSSCAEARPALEKMTADPHPLARLAAARALAALGVGESRSALEKLSFGDPDCGVRRGVSQLLKKS
ncbi:MAG: HEAT repeat domain-containing protein [Elusimicrobia bacterium]|nr:HEAT repeat domain-containing protein [Elusimicrobiota bacterium]